MSADPQDTVLIVYDSQAIRETVSVLPPEGPYHVVELDDPSRLMAVVEAEAPSLVILCAMTGQTSAYESCQALKAGSGADFLPVLVYTLKPSAEEAERAFESGADDVVKVTIKPDELLWRIRVLLRIRTLVHESQQRTASLARAGMEAADMILQLEEAERRIREQNEELETMVHNLEERDRRIRAQQVEIQDHLATLQKEMELASALQLNLLPTHAVDVPGLSLFDMYIPAAELCGDYYDYCALPDGRLFISIADVTGHGVAPALVSVQVRTLARSALDDCDSPGAVLDQLNRFMIDTFQQEFLMTMVCLFYNPKTNEITFSGAGHCPMIVLDGTTGDWRELPSRGLPLGITDAMGYHDETAVLHPGDRVLLYTDGITEVAGEANEGFFGVERLRAALKDAQSIAGCEVLEALLRAARGFSDEGGFDDDVTLVLLERAGEA